MSLADEKYVSVTTFRMSGAEVSTPTWIVALDGGKVGFKTSSDTGKVKRIRNNSAVRLTPSDSRGKVKPGASPVSGTAALVSAGTDFDVVECQLKSKYGVQVSIARVLNRLRRLGKAQSGGDVAIVITLEP